MEWTNEQLAKVLRKEDVEQLKALHNQIRKSNYRCTYHIQTVTGLMNDPNGFSYYNNKWHLFYQWFPFGAVHGNKHWYHVQSDDLVHWENVGLGMEPSLSYDNFGCYSGSGIVKDDFLYLVYTGNHRELDGRRIPYQMIAAIDENNELTKLKRPIIQPEQNYTEHQRDPKIFEVDGTYYILLGAQNELQQGKMLLYKSDQLAVGWKLVGELKVEGYDHFGYMVECPCIEKIGDKWLLLFSPQGLEPEEDKYQNAYSNVYLIGNLDIDNLTFTPTSQLEELDKGFDFYASQTAYQQQYKDTAILVGWLGCSDYTYPVTDDEGWANLLTLPRELTIVDNKLIQKPAANLETLKDELIFDAQKGVVKHDTMLRKTPDACIMHLENPDDSDIELDLFASNLHKGFSITYNTRSKRFTISKAQLENQCNTNYGTTRSVTLESLQDLQIFIDHSTIELFINNGEYVMTSRVFPTTQEHTIRMSGKDINLKVWSTLPSVEDDFVLFPEVEHVAEN